MLRGKLAAENSSSLKLADKYEKSSRSASGRVPGGVRQARPLTLALESTS
jgi:hypothetical protein